MLPVSRTDRTRLARPHPILGVLKDQGRTQTWLAGKLELSPEHLNRVLHGRQRAMPALRTACARLLGVGEEELFHGRDSSAPPGREGDARAATAVRAGYARRAGLSTLQEAPSSKSA